VQAKGNVAENAEIGRIWWRKAMLLKLQHTGKLKAKCNVAETAADGRG